LEEQTGGSDDVSAGGFIVGNLDVVVIAILGVVGSIGNSSVLGSGASRHFQIKSNKIMRVGSPY